MENVKERHLIVRADASTQIGIGHFMRCMALAQAWKDCGGKVVFITCCKSKDLVQQLDDEGFDIRPLTKTYPNRSDWDHTVIILDSCPDAWVVLDGYHFDEVYQQKVRESGHRLLVIDDMAHLKHYYADIVLNQDLHANKLHYTCEPYTELLLGTRYVLLRREFLAWKNWKRDIPEVARRVLVTLGGGDPENHTLKVIQALQRVDVHGLEATVVIGAANPNIDTLEAATRQSRIPVRLVRNARNMPELMVWADMAVSMAGTTTWELLFLGVPTLFSISSDNQLQIAEEIKSQKVGVNLGSAENLSAQSLAESIALVAKDLDWRVRISEKARYLVDGQGSHRILSTMQKGRAVDGEMTSVDWLTTRQWENPGLTVIFLGGKQAGCIGLLTLIAAGFKIRGVVAYDAMIQKLAEMLRIPTFSSVEQPEVEALLSQSDFLISVHGREIVPKKLLELPRFGGINVHPCLYRYKGANPVGRLLKDGCVRASVGVHRMTENVDEGEVLAEEFIDITGKQSVEEVYNALYPYYSLALLKALQLLEHSIEEAKY